MLQNIETKMEVAAKGMTTNFSETLKNYLVENLITNGHTETDDETFEDMIRSRVTQSIDMEPHNKSYEVSGQIAYYLDREEGKANGEYIGSCIFRPNFLSGEMFLDLVPFFSDNELM